MHDFCLTHRQTKYRYLYKRSTYGNKFKIAVYRLGELPPVTSNNEADEDDGFDGYDYLDDIDRHKDVYRLKVCIYSFYYMAIMY